MKVNIITNLNNGVGLEHDYKIVRRHVESQGHEVTPIQFDFVRAVVPKADLNIWLEVVVPKWVGAARMNWLLPNPEWFFEPWIETVKKFQLILCKTYAAVEIFEKIAPGRVRHVGFESRDLLDETVPRERKFIHVAGKSRTKNTEAVLMAWQRAAPLAPLVIVSDWCSRGAGPFVQLYKRIPDDELKRLMNQCRFHIMPSEYEGWGHSLREAGGVRGIVVTTDYAPMNEVVAGALVKPVGYRPYHIARIAKVSWDGVYGAAKAVLDKPEETLEEIGRAARDQFLAVNHNFGKAFTELLAEAA